MTKKVHKPPIKTEEKRISVNRMKNISTSFIFLHINHAIRKYALESKKIDKTITQML